MKASKLKTIWIIVLSICLTGVICFRAIVRQLFGTINRQWVNQTMNAWADKILNLLKVTCHIHNPHRVSPKPGEPTIIMCNHSSLYDIPISLKAFPNESIRMLSKKELSKIPIMGKGMSAAEFPFIDRKNRTQAIEDLNHMQDLLKSGIVMWIAPEGTRSKDGKLAPFKKGGFITAIKAGAKIIPIGIRGAHEILPARTWQVNMNQTAEVRIGEPIDASQFTLQNKETLIEKVHQAIQALMAPEK